MCNIEIMPSSEIVGSGSCIPERVIDGSHLLNSKFYTDAGDFIHKPNEEIIKKFVDITEIEERRYLRNDQFNSDLGVQAAKEAIYDAKNRKRIPWLYHFLRVILEVSANAMVNFMPNMAARESINWVLKTEMYYLW